MKFKIFYFVNMKNKIIIIITMINIFSQMSNICKKALITKIKLMILNALKLQLANI